MPAFIIAAMVCSLSDAGPSVQTIFVLRNQIPPEYYFMPKMVTSFYRININNTAELFKMFYVLSVENPNNKKTRNSSLFFWDLETLF